MLKGLVKRAGRAAIRRVSGDSQQGRPAASSHTSRAPEPPGEPEELHEEPDVEVEAATVKGWLEAGEEVIFLDVREPYELRSGVVKGAMKIPMNTIPQSLDELPPREARLVVYCAHGVRSFGVSAWLREQGWEEAWSLVGGIPAVPWLVEMPGENAP